MAYLSKTKSGKEIKVWTWKEWREYQDSKPPKKGIILSKNHKEKVK